MDYFNVNDELLPSNLSMGQNIDLAFVEGIVQQNYKRFLISGATMAFLSKFLWENNNEISAKKGLYMAGATLVSDLLLGVATTMGYLSPGVIGNPKSMAAQVVLESILYFPIATSGEMIVPNFTGQAFQQCLISTSVSQGAMFFLTKKTNANENN